MQKVWFRVYSLGSGKNASIYLKKKRGACAPSSSLFFSLARGFSSAREEGEERR